jgi:hypothetical protein
MKRIDMECVDDDEILLGTIYKHAFGIIIVYIQAGLGLVLSLGLAFFLLPSVLTAKITASIANVVAIANAPFVSPSTLGSKKNAKPRDNTNPRPACMYTIIIPNACLYIVPSNISSSSTHSMSILFIVLIAVSIPVYIIFCCSTALG